MNKTAEYLLELCEHDKEVDREFLEKPHVWWDRYGITIYLDYDDFSLFKKALNEVRKEEYIKFNFLESYIEEKLKDIISNAFKLSLKERSDFITNELNLLKDDFKSEIKEWTFWIPINNLVLTDKKPLNIGNTIFFILNQSKGAEIIDKIKVKNESDALFKKDMQKNYIDTNIGKVFAEVKARGVKKYARENAMNHLRMVINVLRLYTPLNNINFGIQGEITPKFYRKIIEFTSDYKHQSFPMELMGSIGEFVLQEGLIKYMDDNGFQRLNQILKSKKPNHIQKRILTAIYWFGEAMGTEIFIEKEIHEEKSKNYENFEYFRFGEKYLKLFTAIESILIFEDNEPITLNLSERSALLIGQNYNERKEIQRMLKDLYDIRGKIIHSGQTFVSKYDISNLIELTRTIIFSIIELEVEYKFKTKEDLSTYFDKLKLS